jgi:predicted transglutaminase-like cysteine proteinase
LRVSTSVFTRITLQMSIVFAVCTVGGFAAAQTSFDPLPLGKTVGAPTGYLQFCLRRPDQCQRSVPIADPDQPSANEHADVEFAVDTVSVAEPDLDYLPNSFVAISATSSTISLPAQAASLVRPSVHGSYVAAPEGAVGGRLRSSPELAAEIGEVNLAINRAIKPRTDMEAFGVDNYWTLPLSDGPRAEGNCKHYAMEKRRQLIDDGVPANALSLAIVVTPKNEVHAVLVVSTDQGDLVMDNLTDEVRAWRRTDYRWLARQTPGDPLHWVEAGQGA